MASKNIVLYDGDCGLCNYAVKRIRNADRKRMFQYSPLQSIVDSGELPPHYAGMLTGNEVGLLTDSCLYLGHEAVGVILMKLGGAYALCGRIWSMLPTSIKKKLYRFIASNRNWFKKPKQQC
jgi:predicted DCC family thiol-disulfide oxidoreductase YuxK